MVITNMKRYIGVKIVNAAPMNAKDASVYLDREINTKGADVEGNGYIVQYESRYLSWCPKKTFETLDRRQIAKLYT